MRVIFIMSLMVLFVGTAAYADSLDPLVTSEKEEGLEADHDTMQIHDLEAEQKNAKEQALMQEQISKNAQSRLENVRLKKQETLSKAQNEITMYETRRKEAERVTKSYNDEIAKRSAEIRKLEDSMNKAKTAAKDAEDIAAAGREELKIVEDQKDKMDTENRQAIYMQSQSEAEVSKLKIEYGVASQNLKNLEQRLQANQLEAKKKVALKAQISHELAMVQSHQAQINAMLGANAPASPAVVAQTSAKPAAKKAAKATQMAKSSQAIAAPAVAPDAPPAIPGDTATAPDAPAAAAPASAPATAPAVPSANSNSSDPNAATAPATAAQPQAGATIVTQGSAKTDVAMVAKVRDNRAPTSTASAPATNVAARPDSLPAAPEETIMKGGRSCDVDHNDNCQ